MSPRRLFDRVPTTAGRQGSEKSTWGSLWIALLLVLPLLASSQFVSHTRLDETDSWLYRYFGRQLIEGRRLYVDVWDNKPPGIYWINAVCQGLTPRSRQAEIAVCSFAALLTCAGAYVATRRATGVAGAAAIAAVLTALYVLHPNYYVGGNRPATFIVAAELWAASFYMAAPRRGSDWRRLFLTGLLAAPAALMMQTAVAIPAAVVVDRVADCFVGRRSLLRCAIELLVFAVGMALSIAAAVFVVAQTSDVSTAVDTVFGFARGCFQPSSWKSWFPTWYDMREQIHVLALPMILAGATVVCVVGMRRGRNDGIGTDPPRVAKDHADPASSTLFLTVWFLAALYLALLPPNRRPHYYAPMLPPLVLLASYGVGRFMKISATGWQRFPLWVAALWAVYMSLTPLEHHLEKLADSHHWAYEAPLPDHYASEVAAIQRHTSPRDPIFIVSFEPELYERADRPPACRFIGTAPAFQIRQGGQAIADEIVATLSRYPPKVIVADRAALEALSSPPSDRGVDFRPLATLLETRYVQDGMKESVWVRR